MATQDRLQAILFVEENGRFDFDVYLVHCAPDGIYIAEATCEARPLYAYGWDVLSELRAQLEAQIKHVLNSKVRQQ